MRTVYIAYDGKEFDDEFECEHYEWILNHPNLKYIKIYDKKGDLIEDVLSDEAYNYCQKVVIPTDFAAKDLQDWANYSGYCYFHQITESGIWEFKEDGHDGRFVKVDEYNKSKTFIGEFNKNKVSDEFLDSCNKAGRLFKRK